MFAFQDWRFLRSINSSHSRHQVLPVLLLEKAHPVAQLPAGHPTIPRFEVGSFLLHHLVGRVRRGSCARCSRHGDVSVFLAQVSVLVDAVFFKDTVCVVFSALIMQC